MKKNKEKRERAQERQETAVIKKREKYLPGIHRAAKKFGASVEVLDTAAYVFKKIGNREVGVHINYGTSELVIHRKLETAFTKSATTSKVIKGISSYAKKAKAIRKDLGQASKDIHEAMGNGKGNMWSDPNFGKGFK